MRKTLKKLTAISMALIILITSAPITVQALGEKPSLRLEQVGNIETGTGVIRMRLSGYVPKNQIEAARILFSIDANALTPYYVDKKTPVLLSSGGDNNIYGQKGLNPNLVVGGIAPETFNVPEITYVAHERENDRILIYYEVTAKTAIPSRQEQPLGDLYFLVKDKDIGNLSTNSFRMGTEAEIEEIEQAKEIAALQFGDSDGYWYGHNPEEGYNGKKYDDSTEMTTEAEEVGFTHTNIDMRACTSLIITTGTTTVAVPTKTEATTTTTRTYNITAKYTDNVNDEYPIATDLKWDFCDMSGNLVPAPVGITKAQTNNMDNGNIIVTNKAQAGNVYLRPMNYTKVGSPILFTITKAISSATIMEFTKGADNLQTTSQAFIADGEEYQAIVFDQFGDVLENVAEGDIVYTMPAYNGNTSATVLELTRTGLALPRIKYADGRGPKDVNPEDKLSITATYSTLSVVKTVTIKREELVLTTIDITSNKTGNMVIPIDGKPANKYILTATVKDQFGGNFTNTSLTWDSGEVRTGIGTEIDNFTMTITIAPEALEKDLDITITPAATAVRGSFKGILVKQAEPKISLNLGNSPYAEIEKENKGNDAAIASLKETFDTKYTYSGTKYSKRAWGDTEEVAPYTIEGKRTVLEEGQYINYDKDNKAIFIYGNEDSFIEPGYVLTDENKNVLDPSLVTSSVKVKVLPTISTGNDLDTMHKDMIDEFSNVIEQEITINFTADNIINQLAGLRIRPDIYTINYSYQGTEVDSNIPKTYTAERPLIILSSLGDINADGTVTEYSDIPLLYGSLNNKMPFDLLNGHEIWNTNYGIGSRIHYYRICDINKDGYVNTIDANMARAIYDSDGRITFKEYYKYTSN